jgi:hypothetical protein
VCAHFVSTYMGRQAVPLQPPARQSEVERRASRDPETHTLVEWGQSRGRSLPQSTWGSGGSECQNEGRCAVHEAR